MKEENVFGISRVQDESSEMIPDAEDSVEPESLPSMYFTSIDPYAEKPMLKNGCPCHALQFDSDNHIRVKNLSAYWIPELTVTEMIHGTVYTVTGSYEGEETFVRKLERIMGRKFAESSEGCE